VFCYIDVLALPPWYLWPWDGCRVIEEDTCIHTYLLHATFIYRQTFKMPPDSGVDSSPKKTSSQNTAPQPNNPQACKLTATQQQIWRSLEVRDSMIWSHPSKQTWIGRRLQCTSAPARPEVISGKSLSIDTQPAILLTAYSTCRTVCAAFGATFGSGFDSNPG